MTPFYDAQVEGANQQGDILYTCNWEPLTWIDKGTRLRVLCFKELLIVRYDCRADNQGRCIIAVEQFREPTINNALIRRVQTSEVLS